MPYLTVIKGPDQGKKFWLGDQRPTIGRDVRNTVRLHDTETSRQHAELRLEEDGYFLQDLNSSNGTFLNGTQVQKSPIRSGDKILIGQTEMIFHGASSGQAQATDLANKISLTSPESDPESSAIVRTIKHSEGSQFLRYPERAGSQWLQNALGNLETMYETSQAISRISDVAQLLDHIMDLVFGSIEADRGCVMLKDAKSGMLEPTSVRYAEGVDSEEQITLSQTITDWVLSRNEGVLVLDASQDQRFSSAKSVTQLGIREAICVPLRGRHDTLGVMYVDTKSDSREVLKTQKPTTFSEDHLKLMIAIAHQAGLAIEDSRFYQAMVEAERLAAIGQTIATLSHHIKNILQGLNSGSYTIELGIKEKNFGLMEHGWGVVQKNQEKIYNLVMDMLSFSKEREPALEMTDVNELVGEVTELMASRAKEMSVELTTGLDEDLPRIAVDPEGIHRALLNILTNAIDAVEEVEGARIEVSTALGPGDRHLHLAVTDNGVGIPADQLEGIFQIFESTKGSKGSGLGLAVSQKIVREHGGEIRVTSKVGKGSRFVIEIPIPRRKAAKTDGQHDTDLSMPTQATPESE